MKRYTAETRLTVMFTSAAISLVGPLARAHSASEEEMICAAVVAMLDYFDADDEIRAPAERVDAGTYRVSDAGIVESRDFDPLTGAIVHDGSDTRVGVPVDIHLDAPTSARLADLCARLQRSRAWAIRMSVDRYLFDQLTATAPGTARAPGEGASAG